jgi:hypothetical protein
LLSTGLPLRRQVDFAPLKSDRAPGGNRLTALGYDLHVLQISAYRSGASSTTPVNLTVVPVDNVLVILSRGVTSLWIDEMFPRLLWLLIRKDAESRFAIRRERCRAIKTAMTGW